MKNFFKKVWEWIKKITKIVWLKLVALFKFLWNEIITFFGKFNYVFKFVAKGIKNDNTKNDFVLLIIPSLFTRYANKTLEIGLIWFSLGVKLIISKK